MQHALPSPARLALLPVALVLAALGSASARAGCHLVDCVENVYVKPHEIKGKSCEDLWILRNSIFKAAGYCFTTERAKSFFGNKGCSYTDQSLVPLNDYQRHNARVIEAAERKKGC
jgi:hypothetical protein